MIKFKNLFLQDFGRFSQPDPSTKLRFGEHDLELRFDPQDRIRAVSYQGPRDAWLASLCFLLEGKDLTTALKLSEKDWESEFQDDPFFWESKQELADQIFFAPLELLKASLDVYRGRQHLYEETSPLICRCFGVREDDVRQFLQEEANPTVEALAKKTKASQGCRSCLPQLKRWFTDHQDKSATRTYKDRPRSEWILQIDSKLSLFPFAQEWKMEVASFKKNLVVIEFAAEMPQEKVESVGKDLQRFLASEVDSDLSFFLRRS